MYWLEQDYTACTGDAFLLNSSKIVDKIINIFLFKSLAGLYGMYWECISFN